MRLIMAKAFRCSDVMPGCDCPAVIEGKDDAEVMAKAAEHAKTSHGLFSIPAEIAEKVRAALRDKQMG